MKPSFREISTALTGGGGTFLSLLLAAALVSAQTPGLESAGGRTDGRGQTVAMVGDVNGDSIPDLLVGSPLCNGAHPESGRVDLRSGFDLSTIRTTWGQGVASVFPFTIGAHLGSAVDGLDDLDGDGVDDLLIAADCQTGVAPFSGRVEVISGATGVVIRSHDGTAAGEHLGRAARTIRDMDGDGLRDYAYTGISTFPGTLTERPYVQVRSGGTGALLLQILSPSALQVGFASQFIDTGDVDGDGCPDLILAQWGLGSIGNNGGGVLEIRSGATGTVLGGFVENDVGAAFARSLLQLPDLDGDGHEDFAVGSPRLGLPPVPGVDNVQFFSGTTAQPFLTLSDAGGTAFGSALARLGDFDDDGIEEILVGAPLSSLGATENGAIHVFGLDGILRSVVIGDQPGRRLGSVLTGGFDLNLDGRPDLAAVGEAIGGTGLPSGRTRTYLTGPLSGAVGAGGVSVLRIDGEDGGPGRLVRRARNEPFTIRFLDPVNATPFILWGALGAPQDFTVYPSPVGTLLFTPEPLAPLDPRLLTIADSLIPADGYALVPSAPGDFILSFPLGLPFAARLLLQGVTLAPAGGLVTTNAIQFIVD